MIIRNIILLLRAHTCNGLLIYLIRIKLCPNTLPFQFRLCFFFFKYFLLLSVKSNHCTFQFKYFAFTLHVSSQRVFLYPLLDIKFYLLRLALQTYNTDNDLLFVNQIDVHQKPKQYLYLRRSVDDQNLLFVFFFLFCPNVSICSLQHTMSFV